MGVRSARILPHQKIRQVILKKEPVQEEVPEAPPTPEVPEEETE